MKINPYRFGAVKPLLVEVRLAEGVVFNVARATLGRFVFEKDLESAVNLSALNPSQEHTVEQPFELFNSLGRMYLVTRPVLDWLTRGHNITLEDGFELPEGSFRDLFELPLVAVQTMCRWELLELVEEPSFHTAHVRRGIRFAKLENFGLTVLKSSDERRKHVSSYNFNQGKQA